MIYKEKCFINTALRYLTLKTLKPSLNQQITHLIQQHKKHKWEEHLKANWDHKKKSHVLWSTVKAFNPKNPTTLTNTTITHNNKTAHKDTEKANTLKKYFKSNTKHSSSPTYRIISKLTKSLTSTPIIITEAETTQAIKQFHKTRLHKHQTPQTPRTHNHQTPNQSFQHCNQHKHHTSNMEILQNHSNCQIQQKPLIPLLNRPIALLSPIAKTLEKTILPHITNNITLPTHQNDSRAAHTTTTALNKINSTILTGFNKKTPS